MFLYWILTSLAILSLLESVYSLREGIRYLRFFRRRQHDRPGDFAPPLTLVLPCRGIDPGLEENLRAYFELDYPDFQLLLVTDSSSDPSVPLLERSLRDHPGVRGRLLLAGSSRNRSQKVQNLLYALQFLRDQDEVLAFGDSDIRPRQDWLRFLVAPLADREVGASTGFRWYLPPDRAFASILRSVWNAGITSLMKERDSLFAWGGAMAISREVFESSGVADYWAEALSDDFGLTQAVRNAGLPICFQPQCLSFSYEDSNWRTLLDWTYRQLLITRLCAPTLAGIALAANLLNVLTIWGGGLFLLVTSTLGFARQGQSTFLLASIWATVYLLGCLKGGLRLKAVTLIFEEEALRMRDYRWAYVFWGPLASLVSLQGMVRALFTRTIEWRGIRYRMIAPNRTVVID